MQTQRGFIGLPLLIAIILAVVVLGGGAYYVVHQQSPSQITSDNFDTLQTLPTTNNSQQTTNTPTQTQNAMAQGLTATIDKSSLALNSSTPTITGTFLNFNLDALTNGGLYIVIVSGNTILPSNNIPSSTTYIDTSDKNGNIQFTPASSGNFSAHVMTPLSNGTYTVGIYGKNIYTPTDINNPSPIVVHPALLARGILTVAASSDLMQPGESRPVGGATPQCVSGYSLEQICTQTQAGQPSTCTWQCIAIQPSPTGVTIDQSSLTSSVGNPILSGQAGTAAKGSDLYISVYGGAAGGKQWGSGNADPVISNGHWSIQVGAPVSSFSLPPGTYTVYVGDPRTPLATGTLKINIASQALSASPKSGQAPLTVTFSWSWPYGGDNEYDIDFGDGTGQACADCGPSGTTSHTYTSVGTYSAKLKQITGADPNGYATYTIRGTVTITSN